MISDILSLRRRVCYKNSKVIIYTVIKLMKLVLWYSSYTTLYKISCTCILNFWVFRVLPISGFISCLPSFPSPQCSGKGVLWFHYWILPTGCPCWGMGSVHRDSTEPLLPMLRAKPNIYTLPCTKFSFSLLKLRKGWCQIARSKQEADGEATYGNFSKAQWGRRGLFPASLFDSNSSHERCLLLTTAPCSPVSSDCGCRRLGLLEHLWVKVLFWWKWSIDKT